MICNFEFAILKNNVKSVFNISQIASEIPSQKCFILCDFLGVGGDENLTINFLWPNSRE